MCERFLISCKESSVLATKKHFNSARYEARKAQKVGHGGVRIFRIINGKVKYIEPNEWVVNND